MTRSEERDLRRHCRRMVIHAVISAVRGRAGCQSRPYAQSPSRGRTGDIRLAGDQFNS